jgi:hypothetical protein
MYVLNPGTYFYLGFSIHGLVLGSPFSGKYVLHAGTCFCLELSIQSCLWEVQLSKSSPMINACHVLRRAYEALLNAMKTKKEIR